MPHVTEEIWTNLPGRTTRLIVAPWPEAGDEAEAGALDAVQAAAATFRRSGVLVPLAGDEKRIFERRRQARAAEGERQRRRRARAAPRRDRPRREDARQRALRPERARRRRRGGAGEARALPPRARCNLRRLTGSRALSPWPEEFGLDRMRALLAELGDPQLAFPSVHVVGTNGKSTTTRLTAALLRAQGLRVGAYTSPHVSGWHERLDTDAAGFERAVDARAAGGRTAGRDPVRDADRGRAAEFAAPRSTSRSSRPASAGGSTRRTCSAPRSSCSPTSASTTPSSSARRGRRSPRRSWPSSSDGATVVLCEPEWQALARSSGAEAIVLTGRSNLALAVAAAETFLGRPVDASAADAVTLPGRLERRRRLRSRSGTARTTSTASAGCCRACPTAATSSSPRSSATRTSTGCWRRSRRSAIRWSRPRRATRARFPRTNLQGLAADGSRERSRSRPRRRARRRARDRRAARRGPGDGVAVPARRPRRARRRRTIQHGTRLSVFVFAAIVIAAFAGLAFAVGYVVGKLLL